MRYHRTGTAVALGLMLLSPLPAVAQQQMHAGMARADATTLVGGQEMFPGKDIVDNAVNSADHTTLVTAVKAAGLVETLKSSGPFTVFAPTNAAFRDLPDGTVPTLLKPENKEQLGKVLTYHVVAGRYDAAALIKAIRNGHGRATLATVNGEQLSFMMNGERNVVVRDARGGVADITIYDVRQSNGVIHVVDRVLLPS
jgi:uncharacterized surface protein with fasciclin (FAS1) repeats